jgi:DNA-binding LacI/PurR family transcriptional regulator
MEPRHTNVRLKDIAAQAGVSVMTVSKVMRDAPDISSATKQRIKALAIQMGYVPDTLAQGLRTGATKILGLVISNVTNPIFARIVLALEERAHELGYDLILAQHLMNPEREEKIIRRLLSRRVDGLFLSPVYRLSPKAPAYDEIRLRKTPTVILGHPAAFCANLVSVETEDQLASAAMTQYLLSLGHRRIAFFSGPSASPAAQERLDGYRRALREAHIEPDDQLVFNAGNSVEEGAAAALQMLNEGERPTAIQAFNDLTAIGAATLLLKQGLKIPDDISVTGFGNILTAEYFRVPLTTMRQPKYRLGVAAMELMQKLLRGEPAFSRRIEAEIEKRASVGPPPRVGA